MNSNCIKGNHLGYNYSILKQSTNFQNYKQCFIKNKTSMKDVIKTKELKSFFWVSHVKKKPKVVNWRVETLNKSATVPISTVLFRVWSFTKKHIKYFFGWCREKEGKSTRFQEMKGIFKKHYWVSLTFHPFSRGSGQIGTITKENLSNPMKLF